MLLLPHRSPIHARTLSNRNRRIATLREQCGIRFVGRGRDRT